MSLELSEKGVQQFFNHLFPYLRFLLLDIRLKDSNIYGQVILTKLIITLIVSFLDYESEFGSLYLM